LKKWRTEKRGGVESGSFVSIGRGDGPFRPLRVRRHISLGALAGLAVLLLFVASCYGSAISPSRTSQQEEAASASDRPDIIFVLADDLDYASVQKMPELRSVMVEEGVSFENAFTSQSLCCPSRATSFTGLYAHNHQIKGNKPPDGGFEKFRDEGLEEDTIATRLQQAGYRTAFMGKYLNGYPAGDPTYVPPGWDEWYGKINEQDLYNYPINENGEVVSYGSGPEDFFTDVLSGQATDFVSRAAPEDQPFFAYVAPTAPHAPATPAPRHKGTFAGEKAPRTPSFSEEDVSDKPSWLRDHTAQFDDEEISEIDNRYRDRLESMLAVDEMVASLVEELEAVGELENTYIFFTSDNGYLLGEHRAKDQKDRPYEESARVPLYVRGPGITPETQVDELVLNNDLVPTFAELAGADLGEEETDGRSLLPLLRGEESRWWPRRGRSTILLEGFVGKGARHYGAVRTNTHKYVEYGNGETELYDLEADPYELDNVYETADPSLIEDLKARLEALRDCQGEGCREAEDAS
jgi:N-acetylglucosamine-6-sulfatase